MDHHHNETSKNADFGIQFIIRIGRLLKIGFPRFACKSTLQFIVIIVAGFLSAVASLKTGLLLGPFFNAVLAQDKEAIFQLLEEATLAYLLYSSLVAIGAFLGEHLALKWRQDLVSVFHHRYFGQRLLFPIAAYSGLDNADQRITTDCDLFTSNFGGLLFGSYKTTPIWGNLALIVGSAVVLSKNGWSLIVVPFGLQMVLIFITKLVVKKLTPLTFARERLEGNFRAHHASIRANSESIAFLESEQREKKESNKRYMTLHALWLRFFAQNFHVDWFNNFRSGIPQMAAPLCVGLQIYIEGGSTIGGQEISIQLVSTAITLCISFMSYVNAILQFYAQLSPVAGLAHRLGELVEAFDDMLPFAPVKTNETALSPSLASLAQPTMYIPPSSAFSAASSPFSSSTSSHRHDNEEDPRLELIDAEICNPSGAILFTNLSIRVKPGQGLLIMGESGVGKSSLLRVLCGIWPLSHGRRILPSSSSAKKMTFFLPQRSYLCLGSLKEQLLYPLPLDQQPCSDQELVRLLTAVGLEHLIFVDKETSAIDGLDRVLNWENMLSGGECQRLGFCRLLVHRPLFAIVDECSSALDLKNEERCMKLCMEAGITFVSVAHRKSLAKYHAQALYLSRDGTYEVKQLNNVAEDSAQPEHQGPHDYLFLHDLSANSDDKSAEEQRKAFQRRILEKEKEADAATSASVYSEASLTLQSFKNFFFLLKEGLSPPPPPPSIDISDSTPPSSSQYISSKLSSNHEQEQDQDQDLESSLLVPSALLNPNEKREQDMKPFVSSKLTKRKPSSTPSSSSSSSSFMGRAGEYVQLEDGSSNNGKPTKGHSSSPPELIKNPQSDYIWMRVMFLFAMGSQVGLAAIFPYLLTFYGQFLQNLLDKKSLIGILILALSFSFGYAILYGLSRYFGNRFIIDWRRVLVQRMHRLYFLPHAPYATVQLAEATSKDNIDQRICQDIYNLVDSFNLFAWQIVYIFASAVFVSLAIIEFGSEFLGYCFYYFAGTFFIAQLLTYGLSSLQFRQDRFEGTFRWSLSRMLLYSEQIAVLEGEHREWIVSQSNFCAVFENKRRLINRGAPLYFWSSFVNTFGTFLGFVITGVSVLQTGLIGGKAPTPQSIGLLAQDCSGMLGIITLLPGLLQYMTALIGNTARVSGTLDLLNSVESTLTKEQTSSSLVVSSSQSSVKLEDGSVVTPGGLQTLYQHLDIDVTDANSLLIVGKSGQGKSSLLRVLAGLWHTPAGRLLRPKGYSRGGVFFLPQRTFLSPGLSIRDQIIYPDSAEQQKCSDSRLMEIIEHVHLQYLLIRSPDGLDSYNRWDEVLSIGEQQRLGLARMLYHHPRFAVCDESTSALDERLESVCLTKATTTFGITLISVAHRPSVAKYHKRALRLLGNGKFSFHDIIQE